MPDISSLACEPKYLVKDVSIIYFILSVEGQNGLWAIELTDKFKSKLPVDLAWLQLIQSKSLLVSVTRNFSPVFHVNTAAPTILPVQLLAGCSIIGLNERRYLFLFLQLRKDEVLELYFYIKFVVEIKYNVIEVLLTQVLEVFCQSVSWFGWR